MRNPTIISFTLLMIFCSLKIFGQQCSGSLGEPVIKLDFGRGSSYFGSSIGSGATYAFVTAEPKDGEYTVAKHTIGMYPDNGWHQMSNHTPDDPDGYMMIINSSINPGIIFEKMLSPLCPGTTYEFEAWIANLINYSGIKPNLIFQVETKSGQVLKSYPTNEIPDGPIPEWLRYSTTFTVGNDTELVLKIINLGVGGIGNDFALDDISIRACGPIITQKIDNVEMVSANLCEGQNASYRLEANVPQNFYSDPRYQWQLNTGGGWIDLVGENSMVHNALFNKNSKAGIYEYRLLTAEGGNINSPSCRVASSTFTITVNGAAKATNSGPVCVGGTIHLDAGEAGSYLWTGPNFSSSEKSPTLVNATKEMAGDYTLTVSTNGCTTSATTTVQVFDPIQVVTNLKDSTICEGDSVKLMASGGTSYSWTPIDELSDTRSANPTAAPKQTTVYTVEVSNGGCTEYAEIKISVIKKLIVDAGSDVKILAGQSTKLNAKISGEVERFYWTPSDYLDDPTSLTPVSTPPTAVRYVLTAVPKFGCSTVTSDVLIHVSPNIFIPNSFSPNGDGINDLWEIPVAYGFPKSIVKVINRHGQLVYQSIGAFKPWDGKFNGRELPSAVYYYTVYLSDEYETLSGWINLLR